jgi:rubredoxin
MVQPVPGCTGQDFIVKDGKIGMVAVQKEFTNCRPKRVYYVEGTPFTMGWLIGYLAEPEVHKMASEYKDNVIFDFLGDEKGGEYGVERLVQDLLVDVAENTSEGIRTVIPKDYRDELRAIVCGCLAINPNTKVKEDDLWTINVGVDAILSRMYSGHFFGRRNIPAQALKVRPRMLRAQPMCNAFVAPGENGSRWFGRDFMWPTAGVFQDAACAIIYKPDDGRQFVSQTAPGFVGSLASMNVHGVAVGVNAIISALSDPSNPGFNSLIMVRHVAQHALTAKDGVQLIADAPRGVAWIYPIADPAEAYIVEAGVRFEAVKDLWRFVSCRYRPALRKHKKALLGQGQALPHGVFTRTVGYTIPTDIMSVNPGLWWIFQRDLLVRFIDALRYTMAALRSVLRVSRGVRPPKGTPPRQRRAPHTAVSLGHKGLLTLLKLAIQRLKRAKYNYDKADFTPTASMLASWHDHKVPGPFYFAPTRYAGKDVLVATNFSLAPAMRLTSMTRWIALIGAEFLDDFQWRFDTLSELLRNAVAQYPGGLPFDTAWHIADFLTPDPRGPYPKYNNPDGKKWEAIQVVGSTNLFDVAKKTMQSQFGCYGDTPVTVQLLGYR